MGRRESMCVAQVTGIARIFLGYGVNCRGTIRVGILWGVLEWTIWLLVEGSST